AKDLVEILSSNKDLWVETMMHEELGILEDKMASPRVDALVTFFSFVFFGFMPLVTYILASFIPFFAQNTFLTATILTLVTLFTVGALRNIVTNVNWFKSGLEMLLTGSMAAFVAYIVGFLIRYITTL
ncbi:MAG: VIT1/CCC1 transporter family protein, partial [Athalassotoga sp.]